MTPRVATALLVFVIAASAACSVRAPAPSAPPPASTPNHSATPVATVPTASSTPVLVPTPPPGPPAVGPSLTANLLCDEPQVACEVSLLGADLSPLPGWPVPLGGPCSGTVIDPTGRLFVACDADNRPMLHGFDQAGVAAEGWPVSLPAPIAQNTWNDFSNICGRALSPIATDPQGNVYIATEENGRRALHAFGRAGRSVAGWPQPLPGDHEFGCGGFALAPHGTIRAWGYEGTPGEGGLGYHPFAQRTVYTAIDSNGATLPGWPVGSTGTGSGPLIGADGTLYHESELGNVWAHDVGGQPKPGWPYRLPAAGMSPHQTSDGRLVFMPPTFGSDEIVALGPDGAVAPGWPRHLAANRQNTCAVEWVDCFALAEPAFGPDGTLYLSMDPTQAGGGGSIIAFDVAGEPPTGWPVQLPAHTMAIDLGIDTGGNLVASTIPCAEDRCFMAQPTLLVLGPAGEPVR